jgi:hypothetical protein
MQEQPGQTEMIYLPRLNFNRYEETYISNTFNAAAGGIHRFSQFNGQEEHYPHRLGSFL